MFLNIICLVSYHFSSLMVDGYKTPLPEKLYAGLCQNNQYLMNDCNWCGCGEKSRFMCEVRPCNMVDMFGHFKENIQELHIGMEGHGSWRSSLDSTCQPGMQYNSGNTSCICTKEGKWPHDVCDQLFQVLYEVQITGVAHPTKEMHCNYTKLYLIGCNACFCPKEGKIDPALCTNKICHEDDPALAANKGEKIKRRSFTLPFKSLYAACTTNQLYKIGCRTCKCVENNTLECGDCINDQKLIKSRHICFGHRKYSFIDACNICFCGDEDFALCTNKKCYNEKEAEVVENALSVPGTETLEFIPAPIHDKDCIPGTKYLRNCHICSCQEVKGVKIIDCLLDACNENATVEEVLTSYCVPGTFFETDCLYCRCFRHQGITWQRCSVHKACNVTVTDTMNATTTEVPLSYSVNDGGNDESEETDVLSLDVIRMFDDKDVKCEPDTAYKLDCNYCICLSNGNSLCTFFKCK